MDTKIKGLAGGILIAVATSIIAWWLTSPSGIIMNFLGSPDIYITEASVDAKHDSAHVKIYNSGSKIARACKVTWSPLVGYYPGWDADGSCRVDSDLFTLPPGQSQEFSFRWGFQYWRNHSVKSREHDYVYPWGERETQVAYHYPFESRFYVDCVNCKEPKREWRYLTWDDL